MNTPIVKKIKHIKYQKHILHEIPEFDQEIPIGLLIGGDCSKMIEPRKVVNSEGDGPFAFQTLFGWCISGTLNTASSNHTILCNRIAVQDLSTGKVADHHIVIQEEFCDNKIHDTLLKMYQT